MNKTNIFINNWNGGLPIYSWAGWGVLGNDCRQQALNLAHHPALVNRICLMPDAHLGYGMPIGGVVASREAVIPNAVGVDIGCGMGAVRTSVRWEMVTVEHIKAIMGKIRGMVPVGFNRRTKKVNWEGYSAAPLHIKSVKANLEKSKYQLGTLGGGNHFIELQKGSDECLWVMVHSGSRNFGLQVANEFHEKAKASCIRWNANIPDLDLSYLPLGSKDADEYLEAMNFAVEFAFENRQRIMRDVKEAIYAILIKDFEVDFEEEINIHHNFAQMEHHYGKNVMVHRKGATSARLGEIGIIPGSMGTPSYIVEGLGNHNSFMSCSHGAGRCMGRNEASRKLDVKDCDKDMEGIVFGRWGKNRKGLTDLGEAPKAYKDIELVMKAQDDLVKSIVKLEPMGVIKG